jgi:DNA processing protein
MVATDERRVDWLALNLALWDSLKLLKTVRDGFPDPSDALSASPAELAGLGFDALHAERLASPRLRDEAHKEFDRLKKKGYSLVTFEDNDYPVYLKEIFDPPPVLACAGRTEGLQGPAVAVVGSRTPTPYGRAVAERLAADLASRGIVVVSGLALGIDAIAHWGALSGGRTVAVLGSGFDEFYPKPNRRLMDKIAESGAVVTEFPLDAPPFAQHFPRRNRIISGLARAVVVVEAAEQSGSLLTAHLALEQGREVMAVPGPVTSDLSRGTNALIKAGAKLVGGWEDVAEELPSPLRESLLAQRPGGTRPLPLLTGEEAAVLALLAADAPTSIDDLTERSGRSVSELLVVLLNLELKGAAKATAGRHYLRSM